MLKLKFKQNKATLDITNKGTHVMIFKPEENDRDYRSMIVRILQNQKGNTAAKLKQILFI